MSEKAVEEIKLIYDDGTEEIIKRGCAVAITPVVGEDSEENLNCQFHFLDGTSVAEALYVGQVFNALLRKFQKN